MTSATSPLAVDMSRHVRNLSVDAYEPTRQCTMRYGASSGVDYHPDHTELEEMSIRCSSPYQASPAYRRSVTTPVTPTVLTVDASNHAHNPSVGFYEPTRQGTTHDDESSVIGYQRNDEVDKDTSYRHVSSSHLPPPTSGRRITTSTTVTLATDTLKHAHYLPPRLHESTDQHSKCLDVCLDGHHQEDSQVVNGTGNPRVSPAGPVPIPVETRTRAHGYGFCGYG